MVPISPDQAKSLQGQPDLAAQIKTIFNPNVGTYSVEADIGPAFSTRRQETFSAMTQILGNDHDLMKVMGDLYFKAADFPLADEIAERMKRMVPPQVLGVGPPPAVLAMQQQMQEMQQHFTGLLTAQVQELAEAKGKPEGQGRRSGAAEL